MASITLFRNLLVFEKLSGVHRDFDVQSKTRQYFIILHVFCLTSLHTAVLIYKLYMFILRGGLSATTFIYCGFSITSYSHSVCCMLSAIYCSYAFMSYLKSISTFFDLFKDDTILNVSIKRVYWTCVTYIVIVSVYILYRSFEIGFTFSNLSMFNYYPSLASQFVVRMSIILQQVLMTYVILIIFYCSNCFYSRILEVLDRLEVCEINSGERFITREQIERWVELYRDLVNCCERVTPCFGWQVLTEFEWLNKCQLLSDFTSILIDI